MDVPNLCQGGNCLAHDGCFFWAVHDTLDGNRWRVPSVNDALIIFDGDEDSIFVKDGPLFGDQIVDTVAYVGLQMGQVEVSAHLLSMGGLVVFT